MSVLPQAPSGFRVGQPDLCSDDDVFLKTSRRLHQSQIAPIDNSSDDVRYCCCRCGTSHTNGSKLVWPMVPPQPMCHKDGNDVRVQIPSSSCFKSRLLARSNTSFRWSVGRSEVTYELSRRYQTFRATVGIGDYTAGRGSVPVSVKGIFNIDCLIRWSWMLKTLAFSSIIDSR